MRDRYGSKILDINATVFTNDEGNWLNPELARRKLRKALEEARKNGEALPHISSHALRATFASLAAEKGVDMNVLKELMVHASLSMTADLYCHVYKEQKQEAMKEMNVSNL